MTALVTFCIPVALHHKDTLQRALDSIEAQTIEARYVYAYDSDKRGTGYMRNMLLEQVKTPYVVFLDADDWLEPHFLEACFKYTEFNRYVYTDWFEGKKRNGAYEGAWRDGIAHVVTCLLHTDMVRRVGGFDEKLNGMEDTDLFLKLMATGYCGVRVQEPLFHYSADGQRSKSLVESGELIKLQEIIKSRHGNTIMGNCCGQPDAPPTTIIGERKEGDVKAMYISNNPRSTHGVISGRKYGYMYRGFTVWLDPRDLKAQPQLWREVKEYPKPEPKPAKKNNKRDRFPLLKNYEHKTGVAHLQQLLVQRGVLEEKPRELPPINAIPDFATLFELAKAVYDTPN